MVSADPTTLALEFIAGAVLGGLLGFGTKRVAKLIAIIFGIELMVVRYLQSQGIVIVDWDRLSAGLITTQEQTVSNAGVTAHWIDSLLSVASIAVGFTSGFLIGYYRA
ncbi:FUN14 domain-containing protein [Natrialba aegyptia]|uniref:FUN14 family protein n=1 Tax=Natrialba aegyptia DSM 13077 TaxID=1227491 RepID=M0BKA2_9EURY|nr:FUN14 domain-containing protein [Natrialba aegyptia]ELZ10034.1 FUN14 family protein [Natrialba aegyptia DSM 13077]